MQLIYKELKRLMPLHREQLRKLEAICQKTDHTKGEVYQTTEFNYRKDVPVFYLAYQEQELVGFLSLFIPDCETVEINAIVHPDKRCQGVFSELLRRARITTTKLGTRELRYVCEPDSQAAEAAMRALFARKEPSEYGMYLEPGWEKNFMEIPLSVSGRLKPADKAVLPKLGQINALCFDTTEDQGEALIESWYATENITIYQYILTETTPNKIIGMVCFSEEQGSGSIFALGILPEYRGKGYGAHLLQELLRNVSSGKRIYLQVSGQKEAAFHLYQKAGFQINAQLDYWRL